MRASRYKLGGVKDPRRPFALAAALRWGRPGEAHRRGPPSRATSIRQERRGRPVTVKAKVGRPRYVAFRLHGGPLPRQALSGVLPPAAKLTRFDGTHGIVRTLHTDRAQTQAFLEALGQAGGRPVRVETLATSGTLRKAAEALPPESPAAKRAPPPRKDRTPASGR